ncbi:MAG TPA: recombinase family protein [Woeseiaceae bacterium]|nr:recombinase family protein [Woeseiaceae bacterium]
MARKAALYLRSSKDRHDVSVDSQGRELRDHATKVGDIIVAEFSDRVESAKTDDRPGFQSMIARVKQKTREFDVVYCYDTSRFSRRQYHAQMYKHLLKSQGVELVFLKLPKTDTILDPIIESLMEAFDEFHSQKSKIDGLRGMRENIKQGWRAGGKAILGYKLDKQIVGSREGQPLTKSKLVADVKTFGEIQMYLKGRARGESRRELQEKMRIKVPYSSLVYIEDSALTYAGHTVWNRHKEFIDGAYVGNGRYRPRSEWVVHRDTHEAAISDEEAEAIFRERDKQKNRQSRYRRNHYLLSCLMTCKCGAKVDGDGGYYRCHDRCGVRSIKKETLERAVLDEIFEAIFTRDMLLELQAEVRRLFATSQPHQDHLASQLKKEVKDVDRQIADLAGLLTEVKHRRPLIRRIDSLEDERQELELRLSDLENAEKPAILSMNEADLDEFAEEWRSNLEGGTMDKRKAVFRQIIDSAVFDGEELEIAPNLSTLTGTGVKVASPRGFEPLLPP